MRVLVVLVITGLASLAEATEIDTESARPNILWITSEDNGPHLGAYGDAFADTPNLDELASRGVIYTHAWSNAPVCAPARTTIISGLYPPSTGSQQHAEQDATSRRHEDVSAISSRRGVLLHEQR